MSNKKALGFLREPIAIVGGVGGKGIYLQITLQLITPILDFIRRFPQNIF